MKTLLATVALAALIASPALAQTATQRAARAQQAQSQSQSNQAPSLEGRATGHERTCGFTDYQYDSEGTPMGPYCH
jgi:opacity protein-like surface antigen